jgi:mono/diheme cytochrome c family protein
MKFFKLGLVISGLALFAFACSQTATNTANTNTAANRTNAANNTITVVNNNTNATTPVNDEFAAGKKVFSEKCVLCHKENGEGGQVDIEGDKFKVPSLKDPKIAALDDKKYTRVIEEGDDKMPSFKNKLKPEEIAAVIKYIRRDIQGK